MRYSATVYGSDDLSPPLPVIHPEACVCFGPRRPGGSEYPLGKSLQMRSKSSPPVMSSMIKYAFSLSSNTSCRHTRGGAWLTFYLKFIGAVGQIPKQHPHFPPPLSDPRLDDREMRSQEVGMGRAVGSTSGPGGGGGFAVGRDGENTVKRGKMRTA